MGAAADSGKPRGNADIHRRGAAAPEFLKDCLP